MGHVWVKVKIGDENLIRFIEADALVDTGATLTIMDRVRGKKRGCANAYFRCNR